MIDLKADLLDMLIRRYEGQALEAKSIAEDLSIRRQVTDADLDRIKTHADRLEVWNECLRDLRDGSKTAR